MSDTARTLHRLWDLAEAVAREQMAFDGAPDDDLDEYTAAVLDDFVVVLRGQLDLERRTNREWGVGS
jgi:hypothetical protein